MPQIITANDGRIYEVIEGHLSQNEPYMLVWEDLAEEIEAAIAGGVDRCCAVTQVLNAHKRNSVFVRRMPNVVDERPSDGTERVYLWNVNAQGEPAPGMLMSALERPSRGWYERQRTAIQASTAARDAEIAALTTRIKSGRAARDAAVTNADGQNLLVTYGIVEANDPELVEFDLESAKRLLTDIGTALIARRREQRRLRVQDDVLLTQSTRTLAALDALGPGDWSVVTVAKKIAELYP